MKKIIIILSVLFFFVMSYLHTNDNVFTHASDSVVSQAFQEQQSDVQVSGKGVVSHILPDDTKGSQHQRFILKLDNNQTILVVHNIDLAPRIDDLKLGDEVEFNGEYEWNKEGGVIHWTHRDPGNKHVHGWLKHNGKVYD